jgi:hypothetical protein
MCQGTNGSVLIQIDSDRIRILLFRSFRVRPILGQVSNSHISIVHKNLQKSYRFLCQKANTASGS